ncbi:hypothetical protein SAMN02745121_08962 [Nannocystis exedens]|uniref:Uncharacterized protein n=1 Tax=Nannocystis exedens TaxID=54 RepID=A0A1I2IV22_9BACT|nr:hypothetical protein NAEX_09576 [Nannocystis exedens]PCC75766.1 hypothetical protein NAEX_08879 [Nannocystis exedens]SFF45590.1 hypothetical protein SAMN02745121_08962 [Nannocystis exedens]
MDDKRKRPSEAIEAVKQELDALLEAARDTTVRLEHAFEGMRAVGQHARAVLRKFWTGGARG